MSSDVPKTTSQPKGIPPPILPANNAVRTSVCTHASDARNLVVNLDGTGNQFGSKSTNVVELFSRLAKIERPEHPKQVQLVYYDSGIGTYARPSFWSLSYLHQCIVHTIDTAIAWNFEKIVHAAYQWLSENYQPGDRIYLFGFSRGAYQARVIAGMIEKVGLLHKGNNRQIPFAYELYCSVKHNKRRSATKSSKERNAQINETSDTLTMPGGFPGEPLFEASPSKKGTNQPDPGNDTQAHTESQSPSPPSEDELCAQFKKSLCHEDFKVHFVGAWDTVSSIGVFRGKSLPETVSGMGHVCHFRHALALDERRAKFQPEYVNGGLGPQKDEKIGDVKEVWFAGSHSDIGGGNAFNTKLSNFGPSLRWMTYEAMLYGLLMKPYGGKWVDGKRTESLTGFWKLLEYLPFGALTYENENSVQYWPHLGKPRIIQSGQRIHQSVFSTQNPRVADASSHDKPKHDIPTLNDTDTAMVASSDVSYTLNSETKPVETEKVLQNVSENPISVLQDPATEPRELPEIELALTDMSSLNETPNDNQVASRTPTPDVAVPMSSKGGTTAFGPLSYTPVATLSEGLKIPSWNTLFYQYSKDHGSISILEKDPFENVTHALNELAEACQNLQSIDWSIFQTPLSILTGLLNDKDDPRLRSLSEVPEGGHILLTALQFAYQNQPSDTQIRTTLIRLLIHARPIPQEERTFDTSEIRTWRPRRSLNVEALDWQKVLRSFGQGKINHYPFNAAIFTGSFRANGDTRTTLVTLAPSRSHILLLDHDGSFTHEIKVSPRPISLSVDGSHAAAICEDARSIEIMDMATNPPLVHICINEDDEGALAEADKIMGRPCFSNDNKILAAGYYSGRIKTWKREGNKWSKSTGFNADGTIFQMSLSKSGSRLAFYDVTLKVWTREHDKVLEMENSEDPVLALAWIPTGEILASSDHSGSVTIWDTRQGKAIRSFKAHDDWIRALAFRHDSKVLATGGDDGRIKVWKCSGSWEKIWDFAVDRSGEYVLTLNFSADGRRLLSGGDEGSVDTWDVETDLLLDVDIPRPPTTPALTKKRSLPDLDKHRLDVKS